MIAVMVGSTSTEFNVHSGVISESRVLAAKYQNHDAWHQFSLPDVDPSVFELALCYLYGRDYKDYFSTNNPMPQKSDFRAAAFRRHSLVYCFARKYELEELTAVSRKNVKDLGQVKYQSVFATAKEVYKRLPDEESWFRDCFKVETRRALREHHELVHESWVVETFGEESGNFAVDLFTALMEGYERIVSSRIATRSGQKSSPKIPRWFSPNLSHGANAPSTNSYSTEWTEGDSASDEVSATDATSGDEIIHVEQSPCVEDYTPAGESSCVIEACPEVEPAKLVEGAAVAETLYPVGADVGEVAACYEAEPAQEDIPVAASEEAVDFDDVLAPPPEAEICSGDAQPENNDNWGNWGTLLSSSKSKKDKKNRRGRHLFTLDDAPADEPIPESAPAEEVFIATEEPLAEPTPPEDPAVHQYHVVEPPAEPETSEDAVEAVELVEPLQEVNFLPTQDIVEVFEEVLGKADLAEEIIDPPAEILTKGT